MNGLKEKRVAKKISRKAFANIFGISHQAVAAYESGTREPKIELMKAFANFFNCKVDDLF